MRVKVGKGIEEGVMWTVEERKKGIKMRIRN